MTVLLSTKAKNYSDQSNDSVRQFFIVTQSTAWSKSHFLLTTWLFNAISLCYRFVVRLGQSFVISCSPPLKLLWFKMFHFVASTTTASIQWARLKQLKIQRQQSYFDSFRYCSICWGLHQVSLSNYVLCLPIQSCASWSRWVGIPSCFSDQLVSLLFLKSSGFSPLPNQEHVLQAYAPFSPLVLIFLLKTTNQLQKLL